MAQKDLKRNFGFYYLTMIIACLILSLLSPHVLADKTSDPEVQAPPASQIPDALVTLSTNTPYAFVVDKELRTLSLWKNSDIPSLVAAYPTDIGKNKGNKLYRGDHKTPEGIYFFQETYEQPYLDFSLYGKRAFTMDYPNHFDKMERKTGGGIWLHAIPDSQTLTRGSRGCVVVRNEVIEQLKSFIELKNTPIVVQDRVKYISSKDWSKQQSTAKKWLTEWKKSWESRNLEPYIAHYHEQFRSMGMDFTKWKQFKESLNSKYKFINVDLEHIDIFKNGDQYIFRFVQNYKSDQNEDVGEKHLYVLASESGALKIVGENWSPLTNRALTKISSN